MLSWLWLLSLAVPLLCVWLGSYLFWHATDRPHVFLQEPGVRDAGRGWSASRRATRALTPPQSQRNHDPERNLDRAAGGLDPNHKPTSIVLE